MAVVEQVAAVGDRETLLGVLLDQEDPDAGLLDPRRASGTVRGTAAATSPSEGSSSIRIDGADIMARPTATICRSPPLMVRTSCLRPLGEAREQA